MKHPHRTPVTALLLWLLGLAGCGAGNIGELPFLKGGTEDSAWEGRMCLAVGEAFCLPDYSNRRAVCTAQVGSPVLRYRIVAGCPSLSDAGR